MYIKLYMKNICFYLYKKNKKWISPLTPILGKTSNYFWIKFLSIEETLFLMQSPKNAYTLLQGIEQYKKGFGQERELIEE